MARLHGWRENTQDSWERDRIRANIWRDNFSLSPQRLPLPPGPRQKAFCPVWNKLPELIVGTLQELLKSHKAGPLILQPDHIFFDAETSYWAFSMPSSTQLSRATIALAFWTAVSVRSHHTLFSERTQQFQLPFP